MSTDEGDARDWDSVVTAISAEPVALSSGDKPCLVVMTGSHAGEIVDLERPLTTVGRSAEADFRILDDGVSRIHLTIARTPQGSVEVRDEDSRNGTFLNGHRIRVKELRDGDKIYIGTKAILRFSYADYLEESFQQQMYEAAIRDPLTGLFNRRHFFSQLTNEFGFVKRNNTLLSLIFFDIDHFKRLNDTRGHLVGDEVLAAFGAYIRRTIRTIDFSARYGGEEFVLLCRGAGMDIGERIATRICHDVAQEVLAASVPTLRVTLSAGVAAVPHKDLSEPEHLINAADRALYRAKAEGRNRVCLM